MQSVTTTPDNRGIEGSDILDVLGNIKVIVQLLYNLSGVCKSGVFGVFFFWILRKNKCKPFISIPCLPSQNGLVFLIHSCNFLFSNSCSEKKSERSAKFQQCLCGDKREDP